MTPPLSVGAPEPADLPGLENVVRLSERLYTGGVPEGKTGFGTLARLGIRTLITVDGAAPDVALAKRHGMRYVHLPFGYDGCPRPTANAMVKAVRDLPGPVYLHCHHGKHRSPAAGGFARIALDGLTGEQAVAELERAGTGKNYIGLYADVRSYRPPTQAELDRLNVKLPETAPTPPLVHSMVEIEKRFDRLMQLQKAGWKADRRKADGWKAAARTDPAYEALQLQELYTELNRTTALKKRPADFRGWMVDGERDGKALETALRTGKLPEASMSLGKVAAGCGNCHARYRNVPQGRGR